MEFNIDPMLVSAAGGLLLPVLHAVFDQPQWTSARRRYLVIGTSIVLTAVFYLAGQYPAAWQYLLAQAGLVLGAAQTSFTVLKQIGLLDWVGRVTPGGEPRVPALPLPEE